MGATVGIGLYQLDKTLNNGNQDIALNNEAVIEEAETEKEKKGKRKGKDNEIKGGPPRDPKTGNYLPDPAAEGKPHTTLGIRNSKEVDRTLKVQHLIVKGNLKAVLTLQTIIDRMYILNLIGMEKLEQIVLKEATSYSN